MNTNNNDFRCGHCQRLEPVWEELATQFNIEGREDTVTIASVDCTKHGELCSEQNVQGYPTSVCPYTNIEEISNYLTCYSFLHPQIFLNH